ncbi:peptidase inhibitor family I36 protein [Streptomyces sp. NPDC051742]|uniref:peptidase inhibitor family I36 protein n=1 Tax=unclassified Streptomyces TaxID=2593676 RepID=UPI00343DBF3A
MNIKRLVASSGIALALTGSMLTFAAPANAVIGCEDFHACLYYNSDYQGAMYKQEYDTPDYAGRYFEASLAGSNGAGVVVKNNAASVDNWDRLSRIRIYYNSNYNGSYAYQTIAANGKANLNSTMKNNNASGKFIDYGGGK